METRLATAIGYLASYNVDVSQRTTRALPLIEQFLLWFDARFFVWRRCNRVWLFRLWLQRISFLADRRVFVFFVGLFPSLFWLVIVFKIFFLVGRFNFFSCLTNEGCLVGTNVV